MSETLVYCASGCTVRGQHVETCDDEECRGCAPRHAEHGTLCAWCWQHLNGDVVDAPALARYLWAVGHSESRTLDSQGVSGSDQSELSVLNGAIDALDGLHAVLAAWVHAILEEHPANLRGPDERGVRRTLQTVSRPSSQAVRAEDAEYTYVRRSEVAGVRDPEATSRLVKWLLPHLAWCAGQEWAAEMRREVGDVVRTTAARYPVEQRTRHIPGVECTRCERTSLVFDPPTPERPTVQVNCSTRGCGVIFTEEEFKRLTKIVEWQHEQGQTESEGVA